jgi:hypothetical protein
MQKFNQIPEDAIIEKAASNPWVLGDRVDYDILLAREKSPVEASTHNVARDWAPTREYAMNTEKNLLERIKAKKIDTVIVTITYFGSGELLKYIQSYGTLVDMRTSNYQDALGLAHQVYQFTP